ncbi:MAG: hypothetical protein LUQ50_02485 [Methanospirillum sp.]|uniref:hypothetical protein n=1 Tax=Methanospirillum sp. TaxID=45200 RepID=UPI00236F9A8F|nr:hypothetical protein [Methanospirillum sp.]MDD1727921.1 hypothetical protein [Methanospirillum sp.]
MLSCSIKKATDSIFAFYGSQVESGVGAVSNHMLAGTAEPYLPDNPNAQYL